MKKYILSFILLSIGIAYGQNGLAPTVGGGSSGSVNTSQVTSIVSSSLDTLTISADLTTSADSVIVFDEGRLKIISKAELLEDIYNALQQTAGIDIIPPVFDSLEVGRYNDSVLVAFLRHNDINTDSIPPLSALNLTEDGNVIGLDAILFSETLDSVMIVMDSLAEYGSVYLLDYTRTYPSFVDTEGNRMASFSNMAVSNWVTAPEAYNMLSNGTLDNGSDWEVDGNFTITDDGVAVFTTGVSSGLKQSAANMVDAIVGSTGYTLTFYLAVTGGGANLTNIRIDNYDSNVTYSAQVQYASGELTINFTTPSDIGVGGIKIRASSTSPYGCTIDNIVLQ